ncbi:hypothetical protein [Psychroflexus aestuariivivens]|uniref:hypothetical protein n=1 Tax=Psychroflexus aestuariivivens TaxID=1795040 RepID=UPI000FD7C927|nr:hypothetical protein [Psychroflexus aestuariivivens]
MKIIIQTPTGDLQKSIDFYTALGFTKCESSIDNLFSDGQFYLQINPDKFARVGLKIFVDDLANLTENLQKHTKIVNFESCKVFRTHNTTIQISEDKIDLPELKLTKTSLLGNFAGLSLETLDMFSAFNLWDSLGFKLKMGGMDKSWMTLENDFGFCISFMQIQTCPHLFFNPSLTFFNGKSNFDRIQTIREKNISFAEEITHFNDKNIVDNVILKDPGGLGVFMFND